MADINLRQHEWLLETYISEEDNPPLHHRLELSVVTADLNMALSLSVEFKERAFIDKVLDRRSRYISNPSEVKSIVNAIWVAHFGEEAYEGYIDPSVVLKWGERTGAESIVSLDVAIQPMLDWAEGNGCPESIVKPVRRSLETHARA